VSQHHPSLAQPWQQSLGEGGGRSLAETLRLNTTVTSIDLGDNDLGGRVNITVGNAGTPTNMTCSITPDQNTFSNTRPLLVHYEASNAIVPGTCTNIVAGVDVARPPVKHIAGINLQSAAAAHPLQNCRLYYFQIQMEPQHAIPYNNSNTNKKVIYCNFVTNNYPPVPAVGNFNQLINSGIVHPTGVYCSIFSTSNRNQRRFR
jgi:hypothetical protein